MTDTEFERLARIIEDSAIITRRFTEARLNHLKEHLMSALDDATASVAAKVATLTAEVANANAKTDAALAALAASVASGSPVTQAQIDAINAIGTSADADTASLQAEEAKVDDALAPATGSGDATGASASSSAS